MMRSLSLWALCLLWCAATASYAQPADAGAPPSDAPTLPPLLTAPAESEAPPQGELVPQRRVTELEEDYPAGRFLASVGVGTAATLVGAAVGVVLLVSLTDCSPFEGDCSEAVTLAPIVLSGGLFGTSAVFAIGHLTNGRGTMKETFFGGAMGTGASLLLYGLTDGEGILLMPLPPVIGAAIGYAVSNSAERSKLELARTASGGLQLMPVVGRTPEGGILGGLVGRF
jgi:hypothetical protein